MTADNTKDINNVDHIPSPDDLPPLPAAGERGLHVCEIVRLYLAVLPDLSLTPEQTQILADHIRICPPCAEEQQLVNQATQIVANLGKTETTPSARVDQAVMAAISARSSNSANMGSSALAEKPGDGGEEWLPRAEASSAPTSRESGAARARGFVGVGSGELASALSNHPALSSPSALDNRPVRPKRRGQGRVFRLLSQLAVAAVIVLAVLTTLHFVTGVVAPSSAFALPANLTWSGYVLYHTETEIDEQGERYQVNCYDNLDTGQMHVETIMPGQMDVIVVSEGQQMLGKDMMHHIAQMNPQGWDFDDSAFNLAKLKSDLQAKRATYLDTDMFHSQPVYRIRLANGLVLLLNMHYQPVNVLRGAVGPGTGEPIYNTLRLLPAQKVPDSIWAMQVPAGFHMGTLPPKP